MSNIAYSQLQVISGSINRSISKAGQLGLPLIEMQNLPFLLQREQARDPLIQDIFIIDVSAKILFHSSLDSPKKQYIQDNVLQAAISAKEPNWRVENSAELFSGLKIFDATDQAMGNIIVRYNKKGYLKVTNQVVHQLVSASAVIFILFALFTFLAVLWGFSDVNKVLQVIQQQLNFKPTSHSQQSLSQGSAAYQLALKIEHREKMMGHVAQQIETCCPELNALIPSQSGLSNDQKKP